MPLLEKVRKVLKKVGKTLVKGQEKFLSLTCGNPAHVKNIVYSKNNAHSEKKKDLKGKKIGGK